MGAEPSAHVCLQKQPSGLSGSDPMLGDRDDRFRPEDLFLRNTLPGAAAAEGSPDYVEPPDEGEHLASKTRAWFQ